MATSDNYPVTVGAWEATLVFGAFLVCVLAALFVVRLGPARWPTFARQMWDEAVPASAQKVTLLVASSIWPYLLVGIILGSSVVHPLAIWLRALLG